jgi:hypothetical protein
MSPDQLRTASPPARLWLAYAGACLLAWVLHILAGLDTQRGSWVAVKAAYDATSALWPAALLGTAVLPWVRFLDRRRPSATPLFLACHLAAGLVFGIAWQLLDFIAARLLFGAAHATAVLLQNLLTREIAGVLVYAGIATSFTAVLQSRRARAGAVAAAQAEAALARAELAAITGKLNPHFLFNTLNLVIALTRTNPHQAEQALLQFSSMLRYVLATKRDTTDRVLLQDELEFVRNYLALEEQRLGPRLRVEWMLDPATLQDEIAPLSLQPLVENAVLHGVAPRVEGGRIAIRSERDAANGALHLCVEDDGAGCDPQKLETPPATDIGGIGLAALRRRFMLDFEGQARMSVTTQPGAGFRVDLWIPQAT